MRFEAEFFELVFSDDEAGGGGVVLLRGVAGGDHAALLDGAERAEGLRRLHRHGRLRPDLEDDGVALLLRDGDRHEFVVELAVFPRGGGALVAAGGVLIAGFAGDLVILGEVLGGLDHAGDDAEAGDGLRHDAAALPDGHAW